MVTNLLQKWLDLWHERNGDRHGRDYKSREEAAKRQALYEIQQLYDLKDNLPAEHQWIFHVPLETCLQWPSYMVRAFVNAYKPVVNYILNPPDTETEGTGAPG